MSNRPIWQTLEHPKSRHEIGNRSKENHFTGVLSEKILVDRKFTNKWHQRIILKSPRLTFFPWPDSEMAYMKCDIVIYVWYIFYFLCYTYVWNINSPKICICNHTVFFIKVAYLHPWDGFCCYLKMLPKSPPSHPSPPLFNIDDNICNFWLEQTYFPGIHFKRIYIRKYAKWTVWHN